MSANNNGALTFLLKVKERRPGIYSDFVSSIRQLGSDTLSIAQVVRQVRTLFRGDSELLRGFAIFLPDCPERAELERGHRPNQNSWVTQVITAYANIPPMNENAHGNKRSADTNFHSGISKKRKQSSQLKPRKCRNRKRPRYDEEDTESDEENIDLVQVFRDSKRPLQERQEKFFNLCEQYLSKEKFSQLKAHIRSVLRNNTSWKTVMQPIRNLMEDKVILFQGFNELFGRPVSMHWLTGKRKGVPYSQFSNGKRVKKLEKVQESYYKLPTDCIQPVCSNQTKMALEVVNNDYICKSTMTQEQEGNDSPFTMKADSEYEHNLLVLEDRHFEIDIMIGRAISLIAALKYALEMGERVNIDQTHERLLLQLYGPSGFEMIDLVRNHHKHALPIILPRLQAKWMEWRSVRAEMETHWEEIAKEENGGYRNWTNLKVISDYQDALSNLDFLWAEMSSSNDDPSKTQSTQSISQPGRRKSPLRRGKASKASHEYMSQMNRLETKRDQSLRFPMVDEEQLRLIHRMCITYAKAEQSELLDTIEVVWKKILLPLFDLELVAKPTFVSAKENTGESNANLETGGEENAEAKEEEAPDYEERAEEMELDSTFSWRAPLEDCLAHLEKNKNMDITKTLSESNMLFRVDNFDVKFDEESKVIFADQGIYNLLRLIQIISSHLKDCMDCVKTIDLGQYLELSRQFLSKELTLIEFEAKVAETFPKTKIPWKLLLTQVFISCMVDQLFRWLDDNTVFKKVNSLLFHMQRKRKHMKFEAWMQLYQASALHCLSRRHMLCVVELNKTAKTMDFTKVPVVMGVKVGE